MAKVDNKDNRKENLREKDKKEVTVAGRGNIFVFSVIIIITITFVLTGTSVLGIYDFIYDLGKEKIKNPDGSISIPSEAESSTNSKNAQDLYIGKVLGEKIRLNQANEFNRKIVSILNYQGMNPIQKYQYARMVFEQEINNIIAMHNAKQMQITITSNTNKLIKEIGKRFFADSDGDVDYIRMRNNPNEVNERVEETRKALLLENFYKDYFGGLPADRNEMWNNYQLENTKITCDYINLTNADVDNAEIEVYYQSTKDAYKQCKLTKIVFSKKEEAEKALKDILKDENKFMEIGTKLKTEGKVVNIVTEDYLLIDEIQDKALKDLVNQTDVKKVGKTVADTTLGTVVVLVNDKKIGDIKDSTVFNKVKSSYMEKNASLIDKKNKEKVDNIFKLAKMSNLKEASQKYKAKMETSPESTLLGTFPNLNADLTDDRNFMLTLFKAKVGDVLTPFKHKNGYMLVSISKKVPASEEKFNDMYDDLVKRESNKKAQDIEMDFFKNEKKKYVVVDNFQYVLNYQMFLPPEQQQQQPVEQNTQKRKNNPQPIEEENPIYYE